MFGHRRPPTWCRRALRAGATFDSGLQIANRKLQIAGCLVVWLLFAVALSAQVQGPTTSAPRTARLRIAWGGGNEPLRWTGKLALSDGTFSDQQLLGVEADAAGSFWHERNIIHVDALRPHRFDGFDVTVTCSEEARLAIELLADGALSPVRAEVPVIEAARAPFRQPLDDQSRLLLVHRSPGDSLRIETDREMLIFAPGEEFQFKVRPAAGELVPGTTVDLTTTLSPARGGSPLWSVQNPRLNVPIDEELVAAVDVPLPREEGVYTIKALLATPPGYGGFLPGTRSKPLAERSFQVVVLNLAAKRAAVDPAWQTVWEIDHASRWLRLPGWAQRIPGIPRGPLGSTDARTIDDPLGRFVELPPTPPGGEPHWQAFPLPTEAAGVPHVVEIEYPADQDQHFGLSIVEPNAAGKVLPIGRDSGVYVDGLGRAEQTDLHRHRFTFWPRTNSPLLLVTNLHPTAAARFGRIRVERANSGLVGSRAKAPWQSHERLVTAYIARPLVPETFGASETTTALTGEQTVDDWQTFYESATRLAAYLPYAGYNGAVVSVLADGSAIYPSRHVSSTPLYDTGRTLTGARGLPQHDGLELTLRLFDREGLAFVPAIQLATPLPALEALRRQSDPRSSGLEWVGADGRTWLESQTAGRGLAPYYNLLDDRVQQAVLEVAEELLIRYGHHSSLAGLAVQLSGDGYGQLPGLSWGLDDATIAQFERDAQIRLPAVNGPNRFAARQAALSGPHLNAWRTWRAARVTQFYARLATLVQSTGPDRRLILTTEEIFSAPRTKAQLRPNILAKTPVDRVMLDAGIDHDALSRTPGLVFCPPQLIEPAAPLADRAIDLEINDAFLNPGSDDAKSASRGGALFYHRPVRVRLASFDEPSPWPTSTWIVSQSLPDEAHARRRYALALDGGDPAVFIDGGELLPLGQEQAMRPLLAALQQLPAHGRFSVHRQQPVTVRAYPAADRTMLVVMNTCPWSAQAEISLDLPRSAELEMVTEHRSRASSDARPVTALPAGSQTWPLRLEPYDVQIVRLSAGGIRVAGVAAAISEAAQAELDSRLAALTNRDLMHRSPYEALTNSGFEATGGGSPIPGWQLLATASGVTAELDATKPHSGTTSLYLASRGELAVVASEPLPAPATGQLFLTAFLRGENVAPNTAVRIVFEADAAGAPYRTFSDTQLWHPLSSQWYPYGFAVNNLPLDSTGRMRIKFELDGPGEVWVDSVKLYDLLFPEKDYLDSQAEKKNLNFIVYAAKKAREEGRLSDCVRALESYWPQFLLAYTPAVEVPAIVAEPPPAAVPETAPAEAPAESTSFWWRLVPKRLR
jgi:hypothetical protein